MKTVISDFLLLIALFSSQFTCAQNDSAAKKSYFKVGGNYLSNAVYSGRKDSAIVSYVSPSLGYFHRSGFFVSAAMSLLANSPDAGRIDEVALESGYNFSVKDRMDGGVYASKYFYSNGSYAVTSEQQGSIGAYLSYNPGFVEFGGGADILFSTGTDINVNGNLVHHIEAGPENNKWTISPTAQINAGTQSFYRAYYQNRKFSFNTSSTNGNGHSSGKGHHSGSGSNGTSRILSFPSQNHFTVLDYELSTPVQYEGKRWGINANPVLAIPVNPVTYAIDGVLQKETLSTSFFVEIGTYFKF